ncbi:MAG: hypothetical protein H0U49_05530 [Parachlamydiaceae bacterium]|nr:hypothetical protein [Parachlamydiaceae bacterium]
MHISYYMYHLEFNANYGTIGQRNRAGALLRITFEDGLVGYCDCHPWIELGDLPLSKQLLALYHSSSTPLLNCSLLFARIDAQARQHKRSLFEGLEIPPSHQLVSLSDDIAPFTADEITFFKIKSGNQPEEEIKTLSSWISDHPQIKLRLDFNEKLSRNEFLYYWKSVPESVKQCIDFIEDPYKYEPDYYTEDQEQLDISFAVDKSSEKALEFPQSAEVIVHKPAVDLPPKFSSSNTKLVVTTYLDHPFGQMCAAYAAATLKAQYPSQIHCCGLLSHKCYQGDSFIQSVQSSGPNLIPSKGTGFGFDELLKEVPWQSL